MEHTTTKGHTECQTDYQSDGSVLRHSEQEFADRRDFRVMKAEDSAPSGTVCSIQREEIKVLRPQADWMPAGKQQLHKKCV